MASKLYSCIWSSTVSRFCDWTVSALPALNAELSVGCEFLYVMQFYRNENDPSEAKKINAIAAGSEHSMALADDGTVYTWGNNTYGQLGVQQQ